MRVLLLDRTGVRAARPVKATHPTRGDYLRIEHGEEGRGRRLVFFPLGSRDFPAQGDLPPQDQQYKLLAVSEGRAHILVRGTDDGQYLVLWSLSPGFRGSATYSVAGAAKVLAEGYQAQGGAGRMGGAACPVLLVTGPCRLHWSRGGRLYGSPAHWRAVFDGHLWQVEPDDEQSDAVAEAFA
jgi:hypothetical protein